MQTARDPHSPNKSTSGINHSCPPGFNWPDQITKALQKKLQRAISLARTNQDYKLLHPNECRDNPQHKILDHCHPEAEKRIIKEQEIKLRKSIVPTPKRPARFNKLG